ncbi:MAG: transposase [Chloroflexota bacterium]|nr:transposase [Chloroflexota bacterium]
MKYDPLRSQRFTRHSLRLPDRDYTWGGAYFVTMRACRPEPLFEIPELHAILMETWQALPERFPHVTLDEFVIMPDHIHCIIWLHNTEEKLPPLTVVIGAYKSLAAVAWLRHIRSNNMECSAQIWQRSFHERAIRFGELEDTRQYIRDNPIKLKLKQQQNPGKYKQQ